MRKGVGHSTAGIDFNRWRVCGNGRCGYKSIREVEEVVQNYTAAKLPLEAMWTDIDYMSGRRDFTFDEEHWPQAEVQVSSMADDSLSDMGTCA